MKSKTHWCRKFIWKGWSSSSSSNTFILAVSWAPSKSHTETRISCEHFVFIRVCEHFEDNTWSRHRFILGGQIWSKNHRQHAQNLLDYFVTVKVKLSIDPSRSRTCVLTRLKTQMLTVQDSWLCLHHGFLNSRFHVPVLRLYVWQRESRSYLYLWHNGIKLDTLLREPTPVYLEVFFIKSDPHDWVLACSTCWHTMPSVAFSCVQSHNSTVLTVSLWLGFFSKTGGQTY